jgi:hypothetical protein
MEEDHRDTRYGSIFVSVVTPENMMQIQRFGPYTTHEAVHVYLGDTA